VPLTRSNSELSSESVDLVSICYSGLEGVSIHHILNPRRVTQIHKNANIRTLKRDSNTRFTCSYGRRRDAPCIGWSAV